MESKGDADPLKVIKVAAKDGKTGQDIQLQYSNHKVAGNGSFGVVYQAKLFRTGEEVAIKKVLQDKRFKVSKREDNTSRRSERMIWEEVARQKRQRFSFYAVYTI